MKLQVEITATLNDQNPSYRGIVQIGIEKAVEKFKQELSVQGVESLNLKITEIDVKENK
jgi:hypothetical protein